MQIVKYDIIKNILNVGFKHDNFVVYTEISYDKNKTKQELLQKAYEQVKQTFDYEKTLESHSFTTDEVGEEFVPELPKPTKLDVNFDTLTGVVLDQYGDTYSTDIEFIIEGTDKVRIEEGVIVEDVVEDNEEYQIVAKYDDLILSKNRVIYAMRPNEIQLLKEELLEVQDYIVNEQYQNLLSQGGL